MSETVIYEVSDAVAHVTLNSPDTHNTLTAEMIKDLDEVMRTADGDPEVRVIILMGAGRSFSAGHDISGRSAPPTHINAPRGSVEYRFDFEEEYYLDANLTIRNLRTPTIAGLRGHVVLGGLMTALMCDLVVAEEGTNIWNPSLRHTGTGGEVMVLPWDIGFRKTKEMLWTGDPLDVHEAERLGMINRVVSAGSLEAECQRLADRIALMPPRVVWLTKRALNKMQDVQGYQSSIDQYFVMHQLGHASAEAAEWNAKAAEALKAGGFQAWLKFRDGPFADQASRDYS